MLERKHKSVLWYVPDFFEAMKRAFRNPEGSVGVDELTDDATSADLLILDDLAAELGTDWSVKTLSLVIDRRYRDCRPVAITSNLTGAKLLEAMPSVEGQRIVSRLCEMVSPLRLDGVDLRRA
jgi:DNA replication protein DnaC